MNISNLPVFYKKLDSEFLLTNNELTNATYTNVDCNFVFSYKYINIVCNFGQRYKFIMRPPKNVRIKMRYFESLL